MLHTSVAPDDRWSQTTDCLEVAAAFPQVRFAMAQWMRFHAPSLKLAAQLDNVWVDCSTLLLHCELAVQDSPVVAARRDRVDADFDNPAEVVEVVHGLLGGKYVRGSDNPYQSWSDDLFTSIHTYAEEAAVLGELPVDVRDAMLRIAPESWLGVPG